MSAALDDLHLLVGSYTATGGGNATGISVVHGTTAHTAAVMDDPSFLAVSGDRVYAVSEVADGSVSPSGTPGARSSTAGTPTPAATPRATCGSTRRVRSSSRTTCPAP